MRRMGLVGVFVAALALSACAAQVPVDPVTAPPGLGLTDPANAISYTSWAFALPSRTHGDPAAAAQAIAGLVYLAGQLNTNPQWEYGSPIISDETLRASRQVDRALGVAPTATPQQVVNELTTVYVALRQGDRERAMQALASPIFTLGPERTFALLNDLPFIHMANIATAQALAALNGNCMLGCFRGA